MVSRENKVFYILGISALIIFLALVGFTESPPWANTAVLFTIGVLAPFLVNDILDRGQSEG